MSPLDFYVKLLLEFVSRSEPTALLFKMQFTYCTSNSPLQDIQYHIQYMYANNDGFYYDYNR